LGDIMLEVVFVQGLRNLQSADQYEFRDVLTAVGDLSELALEEADVPYILRRGGDGCSSWPPSERRLSEERFGYLLKVVEGAGQQRVELI